MKLDLNLIPYAKVYSEWIIHAHLRVGSIKLSGENTGINLHDFGFGNGFFDVTNKKSKQTKSNLDFIIKSKNFMLQRTLSRKWKDNIKQEKKICKSYIF